MIKDVSKQWAALLESSEEEYVFTVVNTKAKKNKVIYCKTLEGDSSLLEVVETFLEEYGIPAHYTEVEKAAQALALGNDYYLKDYYFCKCPLH